MQDSITFGHTWYTDDDDVGDNHVAYDHDDDRGSDILDNEDVPAANVIMATLSHCLSEPLTVTIVTMSL